jgi:hypothetical protein
VNGVLVEPGDVAGLAREICGLLGDPKRHARLAAGGKILAGSEFSVEAMVTGNLAVYRMIGGRRPGNAGSPAEVVREGSDS